MELVPRVNRRSIEGGTSLGKPRPRSRDVIEENSGSRGELGIHGKESIPGFYCSFGGGSSRRLGCRGNSYFGMGV